MAIALELMLLVLVGLAGLIAVHQVVPTPRRPQRTQRPGYCGGSSSVNAGPLGRLALAGPSTH